MIIMAFGVEVLKHLVSGPSGFTNATVNLSGSFQGTKHKASACGFHPKEEGHELTKACFQHPQTQKEQEATRSKRDNADSSLLREIVCKK